MEDEVLENLNELVDVVKMSKIRKLEIEKLELKCALYKAKFYGKSELVDKLDKRIEENRKIFIDINCCYGSSEVDETKYKNLNKMYMDEDLTVEEYDFCREL